jgi:enamine deaminase RidA (YjgF/YER057c/UK114 family)
MTTIVHRNPEGLKHSPFFTQAIEIGPGASLLIIGGQNGDTADGALAVEDAAAQSKQALANVRVALEAAGGKVENIVKLAIMVTDRSAIEPGFRAWGEFWAGRPNPPTISVTIVTGLANPQWLVEVEALAALSR